MLDYHASHGLITSPGLAALNKMAGGPGRRAAAAARVLCLSPARGPHEAAVPAQSA